MKREGLSLASLLVVSAAALYGCADGDEAVINVTSTGGGGGGASTNPLSSCPSFATARPQDDDGNDVCGVISPIMSNQTWTADTVWYLPGPVIVGNGNGEVSNIPGELVGGTAIANVTLTIQAGTEVKGRTASFANLTITRGSKIEALGTGTDPITFSSDDDGYDGSGEWGGLIIMGYAVNNKCGQISPCNITSELLSGMYGGNDPADDSGTLRYVIVAEGGYEFEVDEEINGISFEAVGAGTEVDFIQVHSNADDGVEFFGGTVNAKHLVLTGNQDDSVDWDEGFQGFLQHVLVIQSDTAGGSNFAIEGDTTGSLSTGNIYSLPIVANATYIGNGSGTELLNLKASTGGYLLHSVFTWDAAVTAATTCMSTATSVGTVPDLMDVAGEVADCDAAGGGTPGANLFPALIPDVALNMLYASTAAGATTVGALNTELGAWAGNHPGYGTTSPALNPEAPPSSGWFDNTSYAGAVDPAETDTDALWFAGWTLEGSITLP
jgi:hypothetical protein